MPGGKIKMEVDALDHEAIAEAIRSNKQSLLTQLRANVRECLLKLSPKEALTLRLMRGDVQSRVLPPAASADYAGALISFCRSTKHDSLTVDSNVTPKVSVVVESTILSFFSSEDTAKAVSRAILDELQSQEAVGRALQTKVSAEKDWISHELGTLANLDVSYSIAGQLIDVTAHQVDEFFKSAAGKQVMAVIAKVMATSGGKIIIIKAINIAVAKVMASAALKTALLATIKKVGVGVLIKTAVGKALVALLAMVGLAHVPVVWIILPILAGFLAYEYFTFPEKLAEKIPGEVVMIVDRKFGDLTDSVAKGIAMSVLGEVVGELTKVRTDS